MQTRALLPLSGTMQCDNCEIPKYKDQFVGVHGYLVANCKTCRTRKQKTNKWRIK